VELIAVEMRNLEPFIGHWTMQALGAGGRASFEWLLGGRYVLQRITVDHPEAPDVFAVVGLDDHNGGYLQHYFDSRGVTRLYAMGFDGRELRLSREQPDFTPLPFAQRFTGSFEDGGDAIRGRWERANDDGPWELDFELDFQRISTDPR
jgi:hypothetical protein